MSVEKVKDTVLDALNPFPSGRVPAGFGGTDDEYKARMMVRDASRAGLGWLGVMAAVRFLSEKVRHRADDTGNRKRKVSSYIQARYPLMSLDSSTRDTKTEAKKDSAGIDKEAGLGDVIHSLGRRDLSSWHAAAALSAALAGGYAGWRIGDSMAGDSEKEKVEKEIAKKKNQLDALLLKELARTRNLSDRLEKKASEKTNSSLIQALKSAYPLYFLGMLAMSATSSKRYMDKLDKNRDRLKEVQEVAKNRARLHENPILLDDSPEVEALLANQGAKKTAQHVPTEIADLV